MIFTNAGEPTEFPGDGLEVVGPYLRIGKDGAGGIPHLGLSLGAFPYLPLAGGALTGAIALPGGFDSLAVGGALTSAIPAGPVRVMHTSAAPSTTTLAGIFFAEQTAALAGSIQGVEGYAKTSNATGTVTLSIGAIGNIEHDGAGTLTEARSVQGGGVIRQGHVGKFASLYAANIGLTAGASLDAQVGLYVDAITRGTVNWSIFSSTTADAYLSGALGFGPASSNPITAVADAVLARTGAGALKLTGTLTADVASGTPGFAVMNTGQAYPRTKVYANGIAFGPGTADTWVNISSQSSGIVDCSGGFNASFYAIGGTQVIQAGRIISATSGAFSGALDVGSLTVGATPVLTGGRVLQGITFDSALNVALKTVANTFSASQRINGTNQLHLGTVASGIDMYLQRSGNILYIAALGSVGGSFSSLIFQTGGGSITAADTLSITGAGDIIVNRGGLYFGATQVMTAARALFNLVSVSAGALTLSGAATIGGTLGLTGALTAAGAGSFAGLLTASAGLTTTLATATMSVRTPLLEAADGSDRILLSSTGSRFAGTMEKYDTAAGVWRMVLTGHVSTSAPVGAADEGLLWLRVAA
jgi:fibronectin-binding autotransporter adhesin